MTVSYILDRTWTYTEIVLELDLGSTCELKGEEVIRKKLHNEEL
jgi:hypothetical protein